jgi:predicted DNA binding CopG/RHH family protein
MLYARPATLGLLNFKNGRAINGKERTREISRRSYVIHFNHTHAHVLAQNRCSSLAIDLRSEKLNRTTRKEEQREGDLHVFQNSQNESHTRAALNKKDISLLLSRLSSSLLRNLFPFPLNVMKESLFCERVEKQSWEEEKSHRLPDAMHIVCLEFLSLAFLQFLPIICSVTAVAESWICKHFLITVDCF